MDWTVVESIFENGGAMVDLNSRFLVVKCMMRSSMQQKELMKVQNQKARYYYSSEKELLLSDMFRQLRHAHQNPKRSGDSQSFNKGIHFLITRNLSLQCQNVKLLFMINLLLQQEVEYHWGKLIRRPNCFQDLNDS